MLVYRNGDTRCQNGVSVSLPATLDGLFSKVRSLLGLRTTIERVYSMQGVELTTIEEIYRHKQVVVTCGESFIQRVSPKRVPLRDLQAANTSSNAESGGPQHKSTAKLPDEQETSSEDGSDTTPYEDTPEEFEDTEPQTTGGGFLTVPPSTYSDDIPGSNMEALTLISKATKDSLPTTLPADDILGLPFGGGSSETGNSLSVLNYIDRDRQGEVMLGATPQSPPTGGSGSTALAVGDSSTSFHTQHGVVGSTVTSIKDMDDSGLPNLNDTRKVEELLEKLKYDAIQNTAGKLRPSNGDTESIPGVPPLIPTSRDSGADFFDEVTPLNGNTDSDKMALNQLLRDCGLNGIPEWSGAITGSLASTWSAGIALRENDKSGSVTLHRSEYYTEDLHIDAVLQRAKAVLADDGTTLTALSPASHATSASFKPHTTPNTPSGPPPLASQPKGHQHMLLYRGNHTANANNGGSKPSPLPTLRSATPPPPQQNADAGRRGRSQSLTSLSEMREARGRTAVREPGSTQRQQPLSPPHSLASSNGHNGLAAQPTHRPKPHSPHPSSGHNIPSAGAISARAARELASSLRLALDCKLKSPKTNTSASYTSNSSPSTSPVSAIGTSKAGILSSPTSPQRPITPPNTSTTHKNNTNNNSLPTTNNYPVVPVSPAHQQGPPLPALQHGMGHATPRIHRVGLGPPNTNNNMSNTTVQTASAQNNNIQVGVVMTPPQNAPMSPTTITTITITAEPPPAAVSTPREDRYAYGDSTPTCAKPPSARLPSPTKTSIEGTHHPADTPMLLQRTDSKSNSNSNSSHSNTPVRSHHEAPSALIPCLHPQPIPTYYSPDDHKYQQLELRDTTLRQGTTTIQCVVSNSNPPSPPHYPQQAPSKPTIPLSPQKTVVGSSSNSSLSSRATQQQVPQQLDDQISLQHRQLMKDYEELKRQHELLLTERHQSSTTTTISQHTTPATSPTQPIDMPNTHEQIPNPLDASPLNRSETASAGHIGSPMSPREQDQAVPEHSNTELDTSCVSTKNIVQSKAMTTLDASLKNKSQDEDAQSLEDNTNSSRPSSVTAQTHWSPTSTDVLDGMENPGDDDMSNHNNCGSSGQGSPSEQCHMQSPKEAVPVPQLNIMSRRHNSASETDASHPVSPALSTNTTPQLPQLQPLEPVESTEQTENTEPTKTEKQATPKQSDSVVEVPAESKKVAPKTIGQALIDKGRESFGSTGNPTTESANGKLPAEQNNNVHTTHKVIGEWNQQRTESPVDVHNDHASKNSSSSTHTPTHPRTHANQQSQQQQQPQHAQEPQGSKDGSHVMCSHCGKATTSPVQRKQKSPQKSATHSAGTQTTHHNGHHLSRPNSRDNLNLEDSHDPPNSKVTVDIFSPLLSLGTFYSNVFYDVVNLLEKTDANVKQYKALSHYKSLLHAECQEWYTNIKAALHQQQISSQYKSVDQLLFRKHLVSICESFLAQFTIRHHQYHPNGQGRTTPPTHNHNNNGTTVIGGYNIRAIINGPKGSGKSTLLYILLSEALLPQAIQHKLWLYMFVIPINWALLLKEGVDIATFYSLLSQHFVELLVSQRPQLRPWSVNISNFWRKLISQRNQPALPHEFIAQYENACILWRRLAHRIQHSYHSRQYAQFLRSLMTIPALFKETMGFNNVLFVFDNWEVTNSHFANHWSDDTPVNDTVQPYIIEQMKQHLVITTACSTQAAQTGMDVRDVFDSIIPNIVSLSTQGLVTTQHIQQYYPDVPMYIPCGGQPIPVSLFGGCPGYIAHYVNFLLAGNDQPPVDVLDAKTPNYHTDSSTDMDIHKDDRVLSSSSGSSLFNSKKLRTTENPQKARKCIEFYGRSIEILINKMAELTKERDNTKFANWASQFANN